MRPALFILILFIFAGATELVLGQSFNVQDVTYIGSSKLKRDTTIQVRFDVTGTGTTGLSIVPELRVASSEPSFIRDSIRATWNSTAAITNWNSGTSRSITFNVHLFDQSSACGRDIDFDLVFFHNNTSSQAAGNGFTTLRSSGNNQITMEHVVTERFFLPTLGGSNSPLTTTTFALLRNNLPSGAINNDTRVYFYIDHTMGGVPQQTPAAFYSVFNYDLSSSCAINIDSQIFSSPGSLLGGSVVDNTGSTPQTINIDSLGNGVNIFDITNMNLSSCSNSNPLDILGDTSNPLFADIGFSSVVGSLREIKLLLGEEENCDPVAFNFGSAPSSNSFFIDDFFISSIGEINARLVVPSAWRSSTNLLSNSYRVRWYLRRDDAVIDLSVEDRNLVLDNLSGVNIQNPADWFLEARVTRLSTGAVVSTISRDYNHDVGYQVLPGQVTWQGAEQVFASGASNPDQNLDPGETIRVPLRVTLPGGGNPDAADVAMGYVVDTNGNGQVDPTTDLFVDSPLADPNRVTLAIQDPFVVTDTVQLAYQLILQPNSPRLWFYADYTHQNSSGPASETTFRRYIPLTEVADGLGSDNVFGVDLNQLIWQDCIGEPGVILDNPPVSVSSLEFRWYAQLDHVFDDLFTLGADQLPFLPVSDDDRFYVLIRYSASSGAVTQRFLPLRLINFLNCVEPCFTPQEALQEVLDNAVLNWPRNEDIMAYVTTINSICSQ